MPLPVQSRSPPAAASPQQRPPTTLKASLAFKDTHGRPAFPLTTEGIWIGREPDCEIIFDASSATVSRRHAQITVENGEFMVADNKSFNGTLVNGQRISTPVPLYHGDEIQFGMGGPIVRFESLDRPPPVGSDLAGQRAIPESQSVVGAEASSKTMVFRMDGSAVKPTASSSEPQLLMSLAFGDQDELRIGRTSANEITLDGLQISNKHARLVRSGGEIFVEDLNSTNGVFVNGSRVSRQAIRPEDSVQIGSFLLRVDANGSIGVFDTRSKTRVDVLNLTKTVRNRAGKGKIKLLDSVSLSIEPNEFVGLIGPSGAGKSTLIDALNGMRPADEGNVLINDLDLYRHIDSLRHVIGYVPQDDIIHRELSVYRTLHYVARLRLSRDVSSREIDQIINEVLDVTGLTESRNIPIHQLSGGQRKRVSIAVELVTKPSVIFLDEPTSGLDPATEDKVMRLFRQIAESGRTVVMTTHAMENIRLFDKIVILLRGRLVYYGPPEEALTYLGAKNFKELYEKLEAPVGASMADGDAARVAATEKIAEDWRQKFLQAPQYKRFVHEPLSNLGQMKQAGVAKKSRLGLLGAIRQWAVLSRRYFEVLLKDKLNLAILLIQAPIIAMLTFLVMGADQPRDFVYFVVSLVAIWFGTSVAAREIIREKPVYRRERMFNLGIVPYLLSKLFVLGFIVTVQCLLLFLPLKIFDLLGFMSMPGELGGIPQLWAMLLTAAVGISLGLMVSSIVKTSEMATSLVPLFLIPQILFSGLVGVPAGISKVAGLTMPAAWSFDTMKRFSTLDTLEPEGSSTRGETKGLGLYKFIETENENTLSKARRDLEDYKKVSGPRYQADDPLAQRLVVPEMKTIPNDLSGYVTFLHPWMNEVLNQIVLMIMFLMLVFMTLVILRLKDIT
ncbi:MAG: FHA domain-containing protein [Blastocatellia bacterium]|nr:FHA domain-containing protein [Blastocatellia bacterium]